MKKLPWSTNPFCTQNPLPVEPELKNSQSLKTYADKTLPDLTNRSKKRPQNLKNSNSSSMGFAPREGGDQAQEVSGHGLHYLISDPWKFASPPSV